MTHGLRLKSEGFRATTGLRDQRRVSGLSLFFQWRRSAVGTDWQQVWFTFFPNNVSSLWDSNFLIFMSLLFIIS